MAVVDGELILPEHLAGDRLRRYLAAAGARDQTPDQLADELARIAADG